MGGGTEERRERYSHKRINNTKRYDHPSKPYMNRRHFSRLLCLFVNPMMEIS